jgi:hypothetical protein
VGNEWKRSLNMEFAMEIPLEHVFLNAFPQGNFEDRVKQHIIVSWSQETGLVITVPCFLPLFLHFVCVCGGVTGNFYHPFILNLLMSFYFRYLF